MIEKYFCSLAARSVVAVLALAAGSAEAVDWNGYFRAGPGLTSTANASRGCYALNGGGAGLKYRLGNECDFYGEFQLSQGFKKDDIDYKVTLMATHYTAATDTNGSGFSIEQMFSEAKGFDVAPDATFWIGKERGRRGYVYIVDTQFIEMAGVGAGFKGQPIGPGKLGAAYYKTDANAARPGNRFNLEYVDLPAGPNGTLHFFATATKGDFSGGTKGLGLSARYDQGKLFDTSLSNMLLLQYAQGSTGLNANFGDLTAGPRAKGWRIVEVISGQSGALGAQAMALLARETSSSGVATDSASAGGRLSYAFTRHFKLVSELGVSQYKPDGGDTARLTKLTIAPTLAVGADFWARPEFRLYVTRAKWNGAAGNVTGQVAFADRTSGTSFGAQLEVWF